MADNKQIDGCKCWSDEGQHLRRLDPDGRCQHGVKVARSPEKKEDCYKCEPDKYKIKPFGILPICDKHLSEAHQPDSMEEYVDIICRVRKGSMDDEQFKAQVQHILALSRAEGWEDAIRAIFSGDTVELDGKFYKISNADAYRFTTSNPK